jgi:hypothetical protein
MSAAKKSPLDFRCGECGALPGTPCTATTSTFVVKGQPMKSFHKKRRWAAYTPPAPPEGNG